MTRQLFYISCFTLLLSFIFPATSCSQVVTDSLRTDSLDKAFRKQVIENNKRVGLDSVYLPPDTGDVLKVKKQSRPPNTRRFYWNERRANADSLGHGKKYRHSPLYAALFSAALPGLGQAYNRKYWKIPIVYGGFAGLGYAVYYTGSNFYGYKAAYRYQVDGDNNTYGSYKGVDDAATLKQYRDYFKRNYDISIICTSVWYILNIVDAAVDAHLFEWNMKDDLNVSWHPNVIPGVTAYTAPAPGVSLQFTF